MAVCRAIAALVSSVSLVAVIAACKSGDDDRAAHDKRAREYAAEVTRDKLALDQLVTPGRGSLRVVTEPNALVGALAADLEVVATTKVWSDTGPPPLVKTSTLHAQVVLRAHPTAPGDDWSIDVQVTELRGDVRNLELAPRIGTIDPGAFGEPWAFVMSYRPNDRHDPDDVERMAFEHDVAGWVRRILIPVPTTAIGVGARWMRTYTDYFGSDPIPERFTFDVTDLDDKRAKVYVQTDSNSSNGAGTGGGSGIGTITIPIGARGVPTGEWTASSDATIFDHGESMHVQTHATMTIRPHDPATASALPAEPLLPTPTPTPTPPPR